MRIDFVERPENDDSSSGTTWWCSLHCDLFLWKMNINAIWFNKRLFHRPSRQSFASMFLLFFSGCAAVSSLLCIAAFVFRDGCCQFNFISEKIFVLLLILYWEPSIKSICFVPASLLIVVLHFGICINFSNETISQMKKTEERSEKRIAHAFVLALENLKFKSKVDKFWRMMTTDNFSMQIVDVVAFVKFFSTFSLYVFFDCR